MLKSRVITAAVLLVLLLAALFLLPPFAWAILVVVMVMQGTAEWSRLSGLHGLKANLYWGLTLLLMLGLLWLDVVTNKTQQDYIHLFVYLVSAALWLLLVPAWLMIGLNPDSSLDEPAMRNQGVVGRVLTRHVGLITKSGNLLRRFARAKLTQPDLRSNELSGLKVTQPASDTVGRSPQVREAAGDGIPAPDASQRRVMPSILMALVGWAVLIPTGLAMIDLREANPSPWVLLFVMCLVWVADSAAYFAGRKFGKTKLAPSISPGKTWEGVAGAMFGVSVYVALVWTFSAEFSRLQVLPALMLTAWWWVVLAVIGDLFESAIKRQAGVKDSGALLPGHGGLLDRIDALTSTLPLAALAMLLQKLG